MGSNLCVDLSHHDTVESFHEAYEAGFRLVILKATQGTSYVDPTFKSRVKNLAKYLPEMLVGAYHFGTGAPAIAQAKWFLDTVSAIGDVTGCPIKLRVLDYETNPYGSTMSLSQAEDFAERFHHSQSRWPMLYTSRGMIGNSGISELRSPLRNCELWLADYSTTPPVQPRIPTGWEKYRLWQWTAPEDPQCPVVPGIGKCDQSMFPGTADDLYRWYQSL